MSHAVDADPPLFPWFRPLNQPMILTDADDRNCTWFAAYRVRKVSSRLVLMRNVLF